MDFAPHHHLTESSSLLVVLIAALFFLTAFALAWIMMNVNRRRAALANAALSDAPTLVEGECVIAGLVEHADNETVAVRVEIDQDGTEWENSGSWYHKWVETTRRTLVAPFYVRTKLGDRVRVEATQEVYLVDDLDGVILVRRDKRTRVAELIPGEHVIVAGVLRRDYDPEHRQMSGYRDAERGWVIRAPKRGRLQLSTLPLGERLDELATRWRGARVTIVVLTCLAFLGVSPYLARLAVAEETARIAEKRHYVTESDDGTSHHYDLTLEATADRAAFTQDAGAALFLRIEEGDIVPARFVRAFRWFSSVGQHATLHIAGLIALLVIAVLALIAVFRAPRLTRWFEGPQRDHGSGKLPPRKSDIDV